MRYQLGLVILIIIYSCTGCSGLKSAVNISNANQNNDNKGLAFDTNPNNYNTAQMTKNVSPPKYIASNLEKQPLFPVPPEDNLGGDLNVSAVPPSLKGNITE